MPGNKEDALESEIHREWRWYCEDDIRRRREWKRKTEVTQERLDNSLLTRMRDSIISPSDLQAISRSWEKSSFSRATPYPKTIHGWIYALKTPSATRVSKSKKCHETPLFPFFSTFFLELHSFCQTSFIEKYTFSCGHNWSTTTSKEKKKKALDIPSPDLM